MACAFSVMTEDVMAAPARRSEQVVGESRDASGQGSGEAQAHIDSVYRSRWTQPTISFVRVVLGSGVHTWLT